MVRILVRRCFKLFGYKKGKQVLDYDFVVINPTRWECSWLVPKASNRMFERMFDVAKVKAGNKLGRSIDGSLDLVDSFDVEPKFFNMVGVGLNSFVKQMIKDVECDGVVNVLNWRVLKVVCQRRREDRDWMISIVIGGDCHVK